MDAVYTITLPGLKWRCRIVDEASALCAHNISQDLNSQVRSCHDNWAVFSCMEKLRRLRCVENVAFWKRLFFE